MEYALDNAEELHRESPETFRIPARDQRENLLPGELVKLIFRITLGEEQHVERMWVLVKSREADGYVGVLDNDPYCTTELRSGEKIVFCRSTSCKYMKSCTRPDLPVNTAPSGRLDPSQGAKPPVSHQP